MSKIELLRIYSAYLPYGLEVKCKGFDSIYDLLSIGTYGTCEIISKNKFDYEDDFGIDGLVPILYSMNMLTQPIEHNGKTVTPIIELLDKASIYDLSNCEFEINIEDEEIYIDAYNGGRLVDAMFYDGNIFKMNSDTKYYPPQTDLNELMLELHLNVFNLPDSAYIKKENLKK